MNNEIKGYPTIELGNRPKNIFESVLQIVGIKPLYRKFELTPITINNRYRISCEVVKLPGGANYINDTETILDVHNEYVDSLIMIIGIGMVNNRRGPSKRLLKRILEEFTSKDLNDAIDLVMVQCNIPQFIACLQLISGSNTLLAPSKDEQKDKE
jgi:hypothetical protein